MGGLLKRILIVEPQESAALFLAETLGTLGAGYQVEIAAAAEEAGRKAARRPFDLMLAAEQLPDGEGLGLLRRLKEQHPRARLILLAEPGAPSVRWEEGQTLGRPCGPAALLDAVRLALQEPAAPARQPIALPARQLEAIARRLQDLCGDLGAQCIILSEPTGQVVATAGITRDLDVNMLTELVGGGYATTFELARRLGQERALNLTYQEGGRYHVYSSNLGQDLIILVLFGKDSASSRIGSVWHYAKRAIQDLLLLTSVQPATSQELVETLEATVWSPAESWPAATPAEAPAPAAAPGGDSIFSLEEAMRLGLIDSSLLDNA